MCVFMTYYPFPPPDLTICCVVYRVNWLRAKARHERWIEELELVKSEMMWSKLFFEHRAKLWELWCKDVDEAEKPGHVCYANRQMAMWQAFGSQAAVAYQKVGIVV